MVGVQQDAVSRQVRRDTTLTVERDAADAAGPAVQRFSEVAIMASAGQL